MAKYTNLNNIIQEYKVSRKGGARELQELQNRLKDVPVSFARLEDQLSLYSSNLTDAITCAELCEPAGRIFLLDDCLSHDEADEITIRMRLPYARVNVDYSPILDKTGFTKHLGYRLGQLIIPADGHPNAKILSNPKINAAGVVFGRGKKLDYIELIFRHEIM
ncbi:MAG: hypothetical protein V1734_01205 [Nanoarchaeota archaeon]